MAESIVIDITKYTGKISKEALKAKKVIDKLGESISKTKKQIDKLDKSKVDIKLSIEYKVNMVSNTKRLEQIKGIDLALAKLPTVIKASNMISGINAPMIKKAPFQVLGALNSNSIKSTKLVSNSYKSNKIMSGYGQNNNLNLPKLNSAEFAFLSKVSNIEKSLAKTSIMGLSVDLMPKLREIYKFIMNKTPYVTKMFIKSIDIIGEKIKTLQKSIRELIKESNFEGMDLNVNLKHNTSPKTMDDDSKYGLGMGAFIGNPYIMGDNTKELIDVLKELINSITILNGEDAQAQVVSEGGGILDFLNGEIGNILGKILGTAEDEIIKKIPIDKAVGKVIGNAAEGTGLLGTGVKIASALGSSGSPAAMSAVGLTSAAGAVLGTAGVIDGITDIANGETARGATKIGMVGTGAAIGAAIGTLVPIPVISTAAGALIGAGIGGLVSLIKGDEIGDKVGEFFKSEEEKAADAAEKEKIRAKERQPEIDNDFNNLKINQNNYKYIDDALNKTNDLKNSWIDINNKIKEGNLSQEEMNALQMKRNAIFEELRSMYPDIISANDAETGKLEEKLTKSQEITENERERQRLLLENSLIDINADIGDLGENIKTSKTNYMNLKIDKAKLGKNAGKILELADQREEYERKRIEIFNTTGDLEESNKYGDMADALQAEIDKLMIETGFDEEWGKSENGVDIAERYSRSYLSGALNDRTKDVNNGIVEESSNRDKLMSEYTSGYDANIEYIEMLMRDSLGMSIDEAIGKFDEMNEKDQETFINIVKFLDIINKSFEKIPDKKHTDVVLRLVKEGYLDQSEYDNGNLTEYLVNGPYRGLNINNVDKQASGGVFDQPHIGIFGEAGREYIIPTTGANKKNGINLWYESGKDLGLLREHAKGGVFGKSYIADSKDSDSQNTNINTPITVNLGGMAFNFSGDTNKSNIIQLIREQMPQIADDVANTIAEALEKIFPNMKANVL